MQSRRFHNVHRRAYSRNSGESRPMVRNAASEQYPLLRTIQMSHSGYNQPVFAKPSSTSDTGEPGEMFTDSQIDTANPRGHLTRDEAVIQRNSPYSPPK